MAVSAKRWSHKRRARAAVHGCDLQAPSTTSLRTVPAREALRAAWRTSLGPHSAVRSSSSSASTTRKPDPTISSKSSVFVSTSNSASGSGRMVKDATAAIGRTMRDFFRAAPYWRARARSHIATVSGTSPPGPQHRAAGYARAKPGPGHAGHPIMDLYWRTLRVCGQSAPTRGGAARPRRAAEHPPAPRGNEAKTQDRIARPRHTTPDVADSDSGRASVPTRRTAVPRGAAPGRTATA